jgi:cell wall assembly regulator SMI1
VTIFGCLSGERELSISARGRDMTGEVWDRFEAMLLAEAPALLATLRPPATEGQIAAAESSLSVQFPAEIRQAYLRHDGSNHREGTQDGWLFVSSNWWACLADMVSNWQTMVELSNNERQDPNTTLFPAADSTWDELKIAPVWWNEKWIPIGLSGTSDRTYIDLDPAPCGSFGQLFGDGGTGDTQWLSTGLNHYLELLIQRVGSGRLIFRDQWIWKSTGEPVYDWELVDEPSNRLGPKFDFVAQKFI